MSRSTDRRRAANTGQPRGRLDAAPMRLLAGNRKQIPQAKLSLATCAHCMGHGKRIHSITLSARTSTDAGKLMPSAFAAFMFKTNSNFVGCSMGRSAGFAPLRILST